MGDEHRIGGGRRLSLAAAAEAIAKDFGVSSREIPPRKRGRVGKGRSSRKLASILRKWPSRVVRFLKNLVPGSAGMKIKYLEGGIYNSEELLKLQRPFHNRFSKVSQYYR